MNGRRKVLRRPFVVTVALTASAASAVAAAAVVACGSSDDTKPPLANSSGSVNPPEPLGCPPQKPQEKTPCPTNGLSCSYADPTFGCPDEVTSGDVTCTTGLWIWDSAEAGACTAPGPGCPSVTIANGFTCPADASTGQCTYPDCSGDAAVVFTCVQGHLKATSGTAPDCDAGADAADASDAAGD